MDRDAGDAVSLGLEKLTNSNCNCRLVRGVFADVVVVVRVGAFVIAGW